MLVSVSMLKVNYENRSHKTTMLSLLCYCLFLDSSWSLVSTECICYIISHGYIHKLYEVLICLLLIICKVLLEARGSAWQNFSWLQYHGVPYLAPCRIATASNEGKHICIFCNVFLLIDYNLYGILCDDIMLSCDIMSLYNHTKTDFNGTLISLWRFHIQKIDA